MATQPPHQDLSKGPAFSLEAKMPNQPDSISRRRIYVLMALFLAILFWRSPGLLTGPRFWAEEGRYYYSALQDADFFSTLSLLIRGNFQLLTNWIAYLATLAPARYAAHVSTYVSLLLLVGLAGLIGLIAVQRRWSLPLSLTVVAIVALLPQGYEVYLSATNAQWICSATLLLISLLETARWSSRRKWLFYAYAGISGLTGVCSVMLAPVFLARRYLLPSDFHFRIGLILGACAIFHAIIIMHSDHPGRAFPFDLFTLTFPLALQSIWSPLVGVNIVEGGLALLRPWHWPSISAIYIASLVVAGFTVSSAGRALNDPYQPLLVLGAWLTVSMLNVFGSIGDPAGLISGWGGGRYFFLGTICFVMLLGFSASGPSSIRTNVAFALLLMILASGVAQVYWGNWKNWLISGESWETRVSRCQEQRPCEVEAWPGGPDWTFQLKRP